MGLRLRAVNEPAARAPTRYTPRITFPPGSRIGPYDILSTLGAGGMGEVYRARDAKLHRDVAIKVLLPAVANDPDRLARFRREAQVLASLNHPNIAHIHGIEESSGVTALVMELVEGEDLSQRIGRGAMPLDEALPIAQQIANALEAAHEQGIIHRDLKPANIKVRPDGVVKVLDFGLAKAMDPAGASSDHAMNSPTLSLHTTQAGMILGTAAYMSPEQARGNAVDKRADLWSFGVVLYEMLTGTRLFEGTTISDTLAAVLKTEPDWTKLPTDTPTPIRRLLRRCLEKDRRKRLADAADARLEIEDALTAPAADASSAGVSASTSSSSRATRLAWLVAGLFLISTLILSAMYFRRAEPPTPTIRFAISPPEKTTFASESAISPDGQQVAFVTTGAAGVTSLWVRPLAAVDSRQLAGTEGASFPFWSPDSRFLGFFAGSKLRKIDVAGGPSQTLADASPDPRGGAWAPDGTIIFSPGILSPIMRVSASGGPVSEVTKLDTELGQTSHRWPSMMPDGRHFIYFGRGSQTEKQGLYVSSLDASESTFIVGTQVTGSYTEAGGKGYLLFIRESTLMAQPFNAAKMELSGEPRPIAQGVSSYPSEFGPTAYAAFSTSTGHLIYRTGDQQTTRLTWFDRSGKSLGAITEPGGYYDPSLSMDGKKVLFAGDEGGGGYFSTGSVAG